MPFVMNMENENQQKMMAPEAEQPVVKRTVMDVEDIVNMVPKLRGHEKMVERVMHWLCLDKVNDVHSRGFDHPGPPFVKFLLEDFNIKLRVDNEQVLDNLPEGAFVTVSNHPFGAVRVYV